MGTQVSWPADAGTLGCRADLPRQPSARVPAAPGDQAPGGVGAWRIPTPARRCAALRPPAWPAGAVGQPDRSVGRSVDRAVVGPGPASGGEPAEHSAPFSPAPLD